MLRFTTLTIIVAIASAAPNPVSNVFEIDISPEEAQKYLNSPPFTEPQLSGKTAVLPLVRWNDPKFRTAEAGPTLGHYWKNGHEIENTEDYVEEVYDASQYHGQDGLGAFAYGYQAPESSKVENRARSGDVTGSYTYKDGNNEIIKVRYWADSEGFHQEDNRPKVELQPAQETEEVRQARLAHEKAWQEAAAAAAQNPDPQGEYSAKYEYQQSASEPHGITAFAPSQLQYSTVSPDIHTAAVREGKAYYSGQPQNYQTQQNKYQTIQPQNVYDGQQKGFQTGQGYQANQAYQTGKSYQSGQQLGLQGLQGFQASQQQKYQASQAYSGQQQYQTNHEEPEPTGPPRGFFYSFNYPVSIIVPKNEAQAGAVHPGHPVDHDTVSVNSQHGAYH